MAEANTKRPDLKTVDQPEGGDLPKYNEVIEIIKKGMMNGKFRQGQLLSEEELRLDCIDELSKGTDKEIKLSRMPIRQAIAAFEGLGILEVIPKKGTKFRTFDNRDLREIWYSRVGLEEFAIVRLASKRERDLNAIRDAHLEMCKIAEGNLYEEPTESELSAFIQLDQDFHEAIVRAAGYPRLAEELGILRLKLRFASSIPVFKTKQRLAAIVEEHKAILDALEGSKKRPGIRPDINTVRLAFLVHMRNSGRYSWKIEQRIEPEAGSIDDTQDYVFDAPDLPTGEIPKSGRIIGYLFEMRVSTEMCAIWQLATTSSSDLKLAESFHQEMQGIAAGFSTSVIPKNLENRFIDLDIRFHAALCFLAGMTFGEDAVIHSWHTLHGIGEYELDFDRVETILEDHQRILDAIKKSRQGLTSPETAVEALERHLYGAFIRNNFDPKMLDDTVEAVRSRLKRLEEIKNDAETSHLAQPRSKT